MNARDEILARIAQAAAVAPPADLAYASISRDYRQHPAHPGADLVELLVDRLLDYGAQVRRCAPGDLSATVGAALGDRNVRSLVVPPTLAEDWLSRTSAVVLRDDEAAPLPIDSLDGADGVLTGCSAAVAETGSLILEAGGDQGRRALTLVPDYHLCVVAETDIVPDVAEALAVLDPSRPLTWISGPSATSDIELNRVEGVHGPRTLEVIIVSDG